MTRSAQVAREAVRVLLVGLALTQAGPAAAARFSVNPTQVFLSARTTSGLVTLRNESDEPLRFQLTLFAWAQSPDGEMELQPTEDVVFFPQMLTLAGGEERKIRVGSLVSPGPSEKTYRLFIEELPPSQSGDSPGAVRVLTKMGVPIFLAPQASDSRGDLRDLAWEPPGLAFTVANLGTVHFVPEGIVVRAVGADGQVLGERALNGWYILAGGTRRFIVDMSEAGARHAAAFLVEVRIGQAVLKRRVTAAPRAPHP